jgi:hypothetical protein
LDPGGREQVGHLTTVATRDAGEMSVTRVKRVVEKA